MQCVRGFEVGLYMLNNFCEIAKCDLQILTCQNNKLVYHSPSRLFILVYLTTI
jgi:hypothetical protein